MASVDLDGALVSARAKRLVSPEDEASGRWRFAHALVVEATYRGLSKGRRAGLHQELAEWLMIEDAGQADVDESVARHLERALRLREELGLRDELSTSSRCAPVSSSPRRACARSRRWIW